MTNGPSREDDNAFLPKVVWEPSKFHAKLIEELDVAYRALRKKFPDRFDELWKKNEKHLRKTCFRQVPILGTGGEGRHESGLWKFAEAYCKAEHMAWDSERFGFERYADFILYTDGDWFKGEKVPLLVVEAESNSAELFGHLSDLASLRAPHKYLFIDPKDTLRRLAEWSKRDVCPYDWPSTTYHVIEIPPEPALPSSWKCSMATARTHKERLAFEEVVGETA